MTLNQIIIAGDRVEFKRFIKECSLADLTSAWIHARKSQVQDFGDLAFKELQARTGEAK